MANWFEKVLEEIRRKSRHEWKDLARERWTDLRIWIQENGEKACLAGIVLGVFLVVEFAVVLWIVGVLAIVAGVIWYLAEPENTPKENGTSSSFNGDQH